MGPMGPIKKTGLGPNTWGVMGCSKCGCRAFQILSLKDNESHVRRGKRTNWFVCLECGHQNDSIAQNIEDLGQDWQQIKGRSTGIMLDTDEEISDHNWLKWPRLSRAIKSWIHQKRQAESYGRTLDAMMIIENSQTP